MKRLIVLLWVLTLARPVLGAEQSLEEIDRMFGGYLTNRDEWERANGGYRADQENFPQPSENQVNMIERMGEIRQAYWDAYKKGGADLEAAKLQFATILFYRDVYRMLTDIKPNAVPDIFRPQADLEANKGGELLWQLWGNMMSLSTASGEPIRDSAKIYFNDWSRDFHERVTASSRSTGIPGLPDVGAIPGIWQKLLPAYETYEVARDYAEDVAAPFPLPINVYVFDLVRRWPVPATEEQAIQDCKVLLKTFGMNRVFEVAKKVQAAMNNEGEITDPNALGIGEVAPGNADPHNPYWALWFLLTKDNPKLTDLFQLYRSKIGRVLADPPYLRANVYALEPLVDRWNGVAPPGPTSTPTPVPTPPDPKLVEQEQALRLQHTKLWMSLPEGKRASLQDGETKFQEVIKNENEIIVRVSTLKNQASYLKSLGAYELHDTPSSTPTSAPVPTLTATPAPTPILLSTPTRTPAPTPYPEAGELWKERERVVNLEYDKAWTTLPESTRSKLHDEEVTFRDTIKAFDPPTRLGALNRRIEHFRSLTPRSAPGSAQALPPTPAPNVAPGAAAQEELRAFSQEYDKIWEAAWAALPNISRSSLRDQEVRFRDTLKGLDAEMVLQKLKQRVLYLKQITPIRR